MRPGSMLQSLFSTDREANLNLQEKGKPNVYHLSPMLSELLSKKAETMLLE